MTNIPISGLAALAGVALAAARTPMILALGVLCTAIVVVIPASAAKGKLHIPGYAGLAFLAFAMAFLCGRLSGARRLSGTAWGLILAILFFVLVAAAAGSLLAVFFYREPREP